MNDSSPEPAELLSPQVVTFDAIMPGDMAIRAEKTGVQKASNDLMTTLVLSVLAGAFISFGAVFATTVSAGHIAITPADGAAFSAAMPYGVVRLLTGVAFSLGLVLVVIAGAELFTGNNLIVMAWASGKVTTRALLRQLGDCVRRKLGRSVADGGADVRNHPIHVRGGRSRVWRL